MSKKLNKLVEKEVMGKTKSELKLHITDYTSDNNACFKIVDHLKDTRNVRILITKNESDIPIIRFTELDDINKIIKDVPAVLFNETIDISKSICVAALELVGVPQEKIMEALRG